MYYLPIDSAYNAKKFLDITNPELAIFVKYEFWHYYLKELNQRNIPMLSVSSIFRADQIYFKGYGSFQRQILSHVSHFFVQDLNSKKLLDSISINNVTVSGDTRFDRVVSIVKQKKDIPHIDSFKGIEKLFVVGSCWPEDFEVLLPLINDSSIKFIIAPHEIENKFINRIENEVAKKVIRYSQINDSTDLSDRQVIIIDNVGMLSSLYGYGDFAYIGGAFGQGLHNILEAATFGLPIFFGNKNYTKFKEAVDLVNLGGAVAVDNYDELRSQFYQFMEPKTYIIASQVNEDYVKDHVGATEKIIQYCKTLKNEG
ncbi:3-deoxy-D-manno-octulosonic acid transferase [Fulvivirga ligni]|uniref:3-deoxy-D-manno-octulosonic acid transferase n=1 Tax=Fulvivirga ligni TaxID=2904246 RepID=UPI00278C797C|nr:glycosyltransferase N-terminal domain-containing protein [Fulvivirga ligni]